MEEDPTLPWLEGEARGYYTTLVTFGPPPLEFCGLIFPPSLTERHRHMVLPRSDTDCTHNAAYSAVRSL